MAIYLRPNDPNESLLEVTEWQHITRYCFEVGTVLGVLSYIFVQQGGEMMNQGVLSFIKQMVGVSEENTGQFNVPSPTNTSNSF